MLVILTGKSASGKDTLLKKLVSEFDFIPLVSTTSRPIREGEKDGVDYNFVTRNKFSEMIENSRFLEYRSYNTLVGGVSDTWYYGSEKYALEKDKDYVKVLDPTGAISFTEYYGKDNCMIVYVDTRDEIREQRASKRGSFDKTEWDRRLADDDRRFKGFVTDEANLVITNDIDGDEESLIYSISDALEVYKDYIKELNGRKHGHLIMSEEQDFGNPIKDDFGTGEVTYKVWDAEAIAEEDKYYESLMNGK